MSSYITAPVLVVEFKLPNNQKFMDKPAPTTTTLQAFQSTKTVAPCANVKAKLEIYKARNESSRKVHQLVRTQSQSSWNLIFSKAVSEDQGCE
jgi:hypothetical protein